MNSQVSVTGSPVPDDATAEQSRQLRRLRIYPVAILLLAMVVTWLLPSLVDDASRMIWMSSAFGPLICGLLILIWWVVISRASIRERVIGLAGVVSALGVTYLSLHQSMTDVALILLTIPVGLASFGVGAILLGRTRTINRTFAMVLMAATGFGSSVLLRAEGMWGDFAMEYSWRWTLSAEERLLAEHDRRSSVDLTEFTESNIETWLGDPEWPSFRGADGSGQHSGAMISADWSQSPPQELWKVTVGPGWSSFAVAGQLLFTQEQRGPNEAVVCYAANSGREIWLQDIESRFFDPLGGPGPRATPTLSGSQLFVQGAKGQVMCLGARLGEIHWKKDLRELADREPPNWGFSSSPLAVDSVVIVYAGGEADKGLYALDIDSGDVRWTAPAGNHSYCSPQLCRLNDVDYITMLTNHGVNLYDPASGTVQFEYDWPHEGYRAVQAHVVGDSSLLLPTGIGGGTRRIELSGTRDALEARELWTSRWLKPDFNNFVIHNGMIYGFDGAILTCVDLKAGERQWKGGRYGKGQLLLLKDSDLLLVLGEKGELILVKADPTEHQELARIQALNGKTWNHPVVVGDRLYVRNFQEAGCWQLPVVANVAVVK